MCAQYCTYIVSTNSVGGTLMERERDRAKQAHGEGTASPRETINLRASVEQKALIDRAASRLGKTRTEFMLDSARAAAVDTLLDERLFLLDESHYAAFVACLDAPVEPTEALRKVLSAPSPWKG